MSTNARIGIKLEDGSILSAYHHWDGYPEWLGVTLIEHYNTDEKVATLIDGGNMSCCWSTTGEDGEEVEPHVEYYGGEDEKPVISKKRKDFFMIDCWQEYSYIFVPNGRGQGFWAMYEVNHQYDENYDQILSYEAIPCTRRALDQIEKGEVLV